MRRSAVIFALCFVAAAGVSLAALVYERDSDGAACKPSFGTFRAGVWPSACWRPYSDSSPFNQRLPAKPRLYPGSSRIVARLTAQGGPTPIELGVTDTSSDYGRPTYYSARADPLYRIHCVRPWGRCEIEGRRVRIPAAARAAAGGDRHLTLIDQRHHREYDFWQVRGKPANGGRLSISWGGRTRIGTDDSDGLSSNATAAHFGNLAGALRAPELTAGEIDHALVIIARCDSGKKVYPGRGHGAPCADRRYAPAEGMRFQLALSPAEIAALGAPPWKTAILNAMAGYGFYVVDTGGSPWDIVLESGSTYTSFGLEDPWVTFARAAGIKLDEGRYTLDLASDVDWAHRLRVVDPCVMRRSC
jgi:hypothetical protein